MAQCTDTNNCIEVNDLKMHFMLKSGLFSKPKVLKAVDGVTSPLRRAAPWDWWGIRLRQNHGGPHHS